MQMCYFIYKSKCIKKNNNPIGGGKNNRVYMTILFYLIGF